MRVFQFMQHLIVHLGLTHDKAECLVMTLTVTLPMPICYGIEKVMILLLYHLHLDRVVKVTQ